MLNSDSPLVSPEVEPAVNPYELLLFDLLDAMRDNWNGYGVREYLRLGIKKIEEAEHDSV